MSEQPGAADRRAQSADAGPTSGVALPGKPAGRLPVAQRYRLDTAIGRGSSAVVCAATDLQLGRPVTVKLFDAEVAADPALRARFLRQAAKAGRLSHPHVGTVLDAGFADHPGPGERPFVVMEPFGPGSLRQLLDRERTLPPARAVALVRQVASAVRAAHRQSVVHADLKPENVLVDSAGERVKVVDFGLSFLSAATGTITPETIVRRAAYLAPEQVQGDTIGPSVDVYALGALLYEMLVGRPPFIGPTPEQTAARRVAQAARPPGLFDPSIPPALDAILCRALERSPQARWPSVDHLDAALAALGPEQLQPVVDDPTGAPPAAAGDGRRPERASLGVAAPILALTVAAVIVYSFVAPLLQTTLLFGGLYRQAPVPHLVGMTLEEAQAAAGSRGLELRLVGERPTDSRPKGVIVQQSPRAQGPPTSPQPIRVTVSAGVVVPDVRGKSLAGASAEVETLGWKIGRADRGPSPDGLTETIVLQHPAPGEVVDAPGELALVVAE